MQIGGGRTQTNCLHLNVRAACSPLDLIPVDFQISPNTNVTRCTGMKYVRQIKENGFLATRGKSKVGLSDHPATMTIRNFETHRMSLPALSLGDRYVQR